MEIINNKARVIRGKLKVKDKTYLSPHLIRIILDGDDLQLFSKVTVGMNNKIFIPVAGTEEYIRRTYTSRALDMEKNEMAIDFVAHGEEGPASAWAINAKVGDILEIGMKDKSDPLYPEAEFYLLAGDHTALPVISVILETLPAHATGHAIIHVGGLEDIIPLKTLSQVKIDWIIGDNENYPDPLFEAVVNISIPKSKSRYIFTAAEAGVIRSLRSYFSTIGIERRELAAFAYWHAGIAEGTQAN